ncbi:hypothetical protein Bmeg_01967 [Bacillus megaterium]|jgi:hypothetical protein|nr:hypothetical protein [Bacillus sp. PvP124]MDP9574557.1 hypothetical protein [Bacillus sp. 1751]MUL30879.1 hypothetical protein [Priestia megaterium]
MNQHTQPLNQISKRVLRDKNQQKQQVDLQSH